MGPFNTPPSGMYREEDASSEEHWYEELEGTLDEDDQEVLDLFDLFETNRVPGEEY